VLASIIVVNQHWALLVGYLDGLPSGGR